MSQWQREQDSHHWIRCSQALVNLAKSVFYLLVSFAGLIAAIRF